MKTTILKSSRSIPNEYKRIDTSSIPERLSVSFEDQKRVKRLRKPLTSSQREKVALLSKPKSRQQEAISMEHWRITNSSLKYKASKRIKKLAEPKWVVPKVADRILPMSASYASQVSRRALRYIPTNRILELSLPKGFEFVDEHPEFR